MLFKQNSVQQFLNIFLSFLEGILTTGRSAFLITAEYKSITSLITKRK
jgi:hypothetical protein